MRVKSEERRLAILEAATGVFLERGYDAASMAEVSARVGGSKQTLYSYFPSKEELFVAVMIDKCAVLVEPLFEQLRAERDLFVALSEFSVSFLRFITSDQIVAAKRIIHAEGAKSNLGLLFFENGPKRGWTRMREVFEIAMAEGRMRAADPSRAVGHFMGLCEAGPYQRLLEGVVGEVSEAELIATAQAAVDVFARAYQIERPATAAQA